MILYCPYQILIDLPGILTAIGTIGLAVIAWVQLSKINSSNRLNSLMSALDLENELRRRKTEMDETAFDIRRLANQNPLPIQELNILESKFEISIENYLNAADRIAFCIIKDYFPEKDWKREYRDLFNQISREFDDKLTIASPYVNFIDLQEKWKRE